MRDSKAGRVDRWLGGMGRRNREMVLWLLLPVTVVVCIGAVLYYATTGLFNLE